MSQQNDTSTPRLFGRSLGQATVLALLLGVGVFVPNASISTAAEPDAQVASAPLGGNELRVASRGRAVTVSPPPPEVVAPPKPAVTSNAAHTAEVVAKANAERRAVGLPALQRHGSLDIAAVAHANDQRNVRCRSGYLTHTGTDGSNGGDRILRTGMYISRWGENIGCGQSSATAIHQGWMNSPGHRAYILHSSFTHIGVGVAVSDTGLLYWVQTFATLR